MIYQSSIDSVFSCRYGKENILSNPNISVTGVQLDDSGQAVESLKILTAGSNANKKLLPDKRV